MRYLLKKTIILLQKIDRKLFEQFFIKKIQEIPFFKRKKQFLHKEYLIRIKDLRQYKNLTYWNNLFNHLSINKVQGDIVECGVGNGESLSFILFNLKYNQEFSDKSYIGFDSFEGFPEPSIYDKSPRNPAKGDWDHTNQNFVLSNLQKLGFLLNDFKKIKFFEGYFENTFNKEYENINKISLLHLDCDLYSSTKISLETWFNKVEKNGIIVFDEYKSEIDLNDFPGASKAIDNFLREDKKDIMICPITKKFYFIKK